MSRSANAAVTAVYSGTFDPLTLGHEDAIRRAAQMFDQVIIAVAVAHHKKTMFSLDERLEMVREVFQPLDNVRVESFTGLVRDFAVAHGARAMVRGVRSMVIVMVVIRASNNSVFALLTIGLLGHDVQAKFLFQ